MENYIYRIDTRILEVGDIILTNGDNELGNSGKKGVLKSSVIRTFTHSNYSHAMIYLEGTCAHSIGEGVEYFNLSKYFIYSKEKIKVLRFKGYLSEENKIKLQTFVAERHGNEYDYIPAIKSAFKYSVSDNVNKQFCSKLVAEAFEHIGIKIKEEFSAKNINPKDIQDCEKFREIDIKFDEVSEEVAEEIVEKRRRSLEAQTKSVAELRESLAKIYAEYNLEFSNYQEALFKEIPNLKNMPNFKVINSKVSKALKESGFDSFWKYDLEDNPEIYNLKSKKEFYLKDKEEAIRMFIGYTAQAAVAIKNEKIRLEHLYRTSDLEVSYDLMKLFTKIVNKHYSIIFSNFKVLNLPVIDYKLEDFSKFESSNFQLIMRKHLKNMNKIEKMVEQGEKFCGECAREIGI